MGPCNGNSTPIAIGMVGVGSKLANLDNKISYTGANTSKASGHISTAKNYCRILMLTNQP